MLVTPSFIMTLQRANWQVGLAFRIQTRNPPLTTATQTQICSGVDGRGVVSAVFAGLEQRLDLIVIAEERDEQFRRPVLENETQRNITPALEKLIA